MGRPEFLYHGKSFRRFTDSAYTFPFASSLPPLFMILPEQTAIQCFPRSQAGFGLRWGAGFLSVPSCCPPVRRHHFLRARHWRWADRRRSAPVFFFRCGLLGRLGGSCLLRDSSCRGLRFSHRGGLRRGLCRDGIIRFRLPGRLRGWLGTCLRPVQCKGSGKHHGDHHNGQDYFFSSLLFSFLYLGALRHQPATL